MTGLDGAVVLAVVVGWLYFIGALYTSAYYRELGLTGYSPTYEFHLIVMAGASSLLSGTLIGSLWLLLAGEMLFLILILLALLRSLRRVRLALASARRKRAKMRKSATRLTAAKRVGLAIAWFEGLSKPIAYFFLLLGFVAGTALIAERRGADVASSVRRAFLDLSVGSRLVYLSNGARLRLGPRVACDELACAYLVSNGVIVLARDRIVSEALVVALDKGGKRRQVR